MLMTVLAILAVDFPVFPRAFAKCETFGVSLVHIYTSMRYLHPGSLILSCNMLDGSWSRVLRFRARPGIRDANLEDPKLSRFTSRS
jgi:hypothetical protein